MALVSVPGPQSAGKKSQMAVPKRKVRVRGADTILGIRNWLFFRMASSTKVAAPLSVKKAVPSQVGFVRFI